MSQFKRSKLRGLRARGFQVQTARQQVQADECPAVACEEPEPAGDGSAFVQALGGRTVATDRRPRRATEVGSRSGGILREQCGGGYRVRRVGASY